MAESQSQKSYMKITASSSTASTLAARTEAERTEGTVQTDALPFNEQAEVASGTTRSAIPSSVVARRPRSDSDDDDDDDEADDLFHDATDEIQERTSRVLNITEDDQDVAEGNDRMRPRIRVQKNYINTVQGDLHIGPRLSQTVNYVGGAAAKDSLDHRRRRSQLSREEKEHIMKCAKSKRRLTSEELEDVSARVGADWKSVGNGLKLPHPVLDSIDANSTWSLGDKVEDMLKRWMGYRGDRATVSRLTKALFNHHEFDAIAAVEP